jgi:hypothetical protein
MPVDRTSIVDRRLPLGVPARLTTRGRAALRLASVRRPLPAPNPSSGCCANGRAVSPLATSGYTGASMRVASTLGLVLAIVLALAAAPAAASSASSGLENSHLGLSGRISRKSLSSRAQLIRPPVGCEVGYAHRQKARYYSPELGRFLSRDPAGYVDGLNLYQYVRGNPATLTDPDGQQAKPNNPAQQAQLAARHRLWLRRMIERSRDEATLQRIARGTRPPNEGLGGTDARVSGVDSRGRPNRSGGSSGSANPQDATRRAMETAARDVANSKSNQPVETKAPERRPSDGFKTVYTATDGPVDLSRQPDPQAKPGTSRAMGGTFVTETDITTPKEFQRHHDANVPKHNRPAGEYPKVVTAITVPESSIRPDPHGRPPSGWLPPGAPGAQVVRTYDVAQDAQGLPTITPSGD